MYLSPHPHLDCLPHASQPPGIVVHPNHSTYRPGNSYRTRDKVNDKRCRRREMSVCIAVCMMLGRSIQTLYVDIRKRMKIKQRKRKEQRQLSERSHGYARPQPSGRGEEYRHLGDHGEELSRDPDHDHYNGLNNPSSRPQSHRTVAPRPLDWLDTETVDPAEDAPPVYDHGAARLPPYDHTLPGSLPRRGRRRHRRSHHEISAGHINTRACTGIRIRECPGLDVNQGAVIWYDALEDRYEVISRSLAPRMEPSLPPPYMPNSCYVTRI